MLSRILFHYFLMFSRLAVDFMLRKFSKLQIVCQNLPKNDFLCPAAHKLFRRNSAMPAFTLLAEDLLSESLNKQKSCEDAGHAPPWENLEFKVSKLSFDDEFDDFCLAFSDSF